VGYVCITYELSEENMELCLTNSEKYELLDIDLEEVCNEVNEEFLLKEWHVFEKSELDRMKEALGESTELEIETVIEAENTRLSFYSLNNQIIVVKRKRINIRLFLEMLAEAFNFRAGNNETKVITIFVVLLKVYLNVLNEDVSFVYAHLCYEYFTNGRKFNNVEIYVELNKYLKKYFGVGWPNDKLNKILLKLEELHVIEFVDGFLNVNDKIYFD